MFQPIIRAAAEDACCMVAPNALSAEVRQLRDHLVASRDLLDALADFRPADDDATATDATAASRTSGGLAD